jgi:membrane-associated phospholipid phosphatase
MKRSSLVAWFITLTLCATPALAQTAADEATSPTTPASAEAVAAVTATAPVQSVLPSWGSLFTGLGNDFRQLPSWETGAILGVAGGLSLAVHEQDSRWTEKISGSPALEETFESGSTIGGGLEQIGVAVATFAAGRATHHPQMASVGADLVRAQIVNSVLTQSIKLTVDRQRPNGGHFSFPSGHTSGTFATATVLQRHFGWKVGIPAYGLAAFVAGSRIQTSSHFTSDVIFGAAVGIVAGRAVTVGHGKAKFAVTPLAAPGGAGVGLTLLGAR